MEPLKSTPLQGNNIGSFVFENGGISRMELLIYMQMQYWVAPKFLQKYNGVKMQRAVYNKICSASEIHQKLRTTTMLRLAVIFPCWLIMFAERVDFVKTRKDRALFWLAHCFKLSDGCIARKLLSGNVKKSLWWFSITIRNLSKKTK